MAAQNSNNNENHTGFNINAIKNICSKYKKYIATGAMLILLAVVISTSSKASKNQDPKDPGTQQEATNTDGENQDSQNTMEVNAYPQINGLFEDYYKYYAAGDTESIEKIAFPISDTEKSYIKCFSKCMDSYEQIDCYTKKGIAEGEYVVTVYTEMKFKDVETGAPNLDSFYVRRDKNGNSYIDNAYSSFNETNKENEREDEIITLISEFSQDEDVIKLSKDVEGKYDEALEKDEDLKNMVFTTVPDVLSEWVATFSSTSVDDENAGGNEKDQKDQKDEKDKQDTQDPEEKDPDEKETGQKDDETGSNETNENDPSGEADAKEPSDEEVKTRTAYAKTKVNMREKRSTSSEILQTLNAGTKVTIYGTSQDGWFKVKCKGKTGYIAKEYIVSDPSKVEVQKRTAYAKTKVNMRKQRSTDSDVVQTLNAGTKVMIYGTSKDGWFRVRSKGKFGYVKKEYIVSSKSKVEKDTTTSQGQSSPNYLNEGDRITLTQSVNIRTSMSETADRVGLAYQGDVVTVIMSYAEGWSKVSWNGQTGYAKTEFLR
ncbi:MAG: SH3 domain-containing protein [Eubacterium sp.]|nr:SH3 domain-containing protein [Eubacterium sp.]